MPYTRTRLEDWAVSRGGYELLKRAVGRLAATGEVPSRTPYAQGLSVTVNSQAGFKLHRQLGPTGGVRATAAADAAGIVMLQLAWDRTEDHSEVGTRGPPTRRVRAWPLPWPTAPRTVLDAMPRVLKLAPIKVDLEALATTASREPFDQLGYEMLARSGQMTEQVVASTQRATPSAGLTLDAAVIGGLLVRVSKLTRGIFDATQAQESEAHLVLTRCAAETAITLRWLVRYGDDRSFRRFRADSFAYWRRELERMRSAATEREDEGSRVTREKVEEHVEREREAAGISWEDVPRAPNSWGPNLRKRCEELDQGWLYNALFASHSNYVHPSWHELRTFHLRSDDAALHLDPAFGGSSPIAAYGVACIIAEACAAAAGFLPCDLEPANVTERVANTVKASRLLAHEFSEFAVRGGLDDDLARHRQR